MVFQETLLLFKGHSDCVIHSVFTLLLGVRSQVLTFAQYVLLPTEPYHQTPPK